MARAPKPPPATPKKIAPPRRVPWWNTRGFVSVLGAAGTLAGVFAYSGSSAWAVAYRLATDGLLLLTWLACGAGAGGLALTLLRGILRKRGARADDPAGPPRRSRRRIAGRRSPLFRHRHRIRTGPDRPLRLGLGLLGGLNRTTAIALLAAGATAAPRHSPFIAAGGSRRGRRRKRKRREIRRTRQARREKHRSSNPSLLGPAPAGWGWAWLAVVPFLTIAVVGTMVTPGLLWKPQEPLGYDVVEYHLQVPREWYEAGKIVPLRHNVFSLFPFGVEVHYLLAMHLGGGPWAGMYLAQLMHLGLIVLLVLAVYAFARRLAPSPASATVAGVAAATIPWLTQLAAIAYNEGGFLLYSTLAVGWAARGVIEPEGRIACFVLGGASAGLACGAKLTAVPEILVGVPLVCLAVGAGLPALRRVAGRRRGPREEDAARGFADPPAPSAQSSPDSGERSRATVANHPLQPADRQAPDPLPDPKPNAAALRPTTPSGSARSPSASSACSCSPPGCSATWPGPATPSSPRRRASWARPGSATCRSNGGSGRTTPRGKSTRRGSASRTTPKPVNSSPRAGWRKDGGRSCRAGSSATSLCP